MQHPCSEGKGVLGWVPEMDRLFLERVRYRSSVGRKGERVSSARGGEKLGS